MITKTEHSSPRSSSCENAKSVVPFSVNESDLLPNDFDSAHASIADWVDIFEQKKLKDVRILSDLGDIDFSEEHSLVKVPEIEEFSVIDALNEGFLNEPSEFVTTTATFHLGEVIDRFENLET